MRASVTYVPHDRVQPAELWASLCRASTEFPDESLLEVARTERAQHVYQAILLAELARERDLDHLHAHFASVATTVTRLAARLAGISYSFTAHAKDIFHDSVDDDDLGRKLHDATDIPVGKA